MAIKHLEFDLYGYIAGASLTADYQDVLALSDDADVLLVFNTCDQAILLEVPSKLSTQEVRLPARASFTIDCRTNSKRIARGTIRAKHAGGVPTTGELSITAVR